LGSSGSARCSDSAPQRKRASCLNATLKSDDRQRISLLFVFNDCLLCVDRVSSFVDNMEDDFAEVSASQAALDDEAEEEGDDHPVIDDDVC